MKVLLGSDFDGRCLKLLILVKFLSSKYDHEDVMLRHMRAGLSMSAQRLRGSELVP